MRSMPVSEVIVDCGLRTQGQVTARMLAGTPLGSTQRSRAVADQVLFRLRRGVYGLAPLPPLPRYVVTDKGVAAAYVAHVRAVLLSLGKSATAAGRTAAALRGWGMLVEPSRTIDVAVPHGRSRARLKNVRITQRRALAREQVSVMEGTDALWITTAEQTVIECCVELPELEAIVIGDSALRSGQVTLEQLQRAARAMPGIREAARVRRVLALLDPAAGSVLESVLRYRLLIDGVIGFTTQLTVRPRGRAALRVDFCFEAERLVVEADGAKWHPEPGPDRQRDNQLARMGYRVLRYTWAEIVHEPERVVREIREALGHKDFQFAESAGAKAA